MQIMVLTCLCVQHLLAKSILGVVHLISFLVVLRIQKVVSKGRALKSLVLETKLSPSIEFVITSKRYVFERLVVTHCTIYLAA